MKIWKDQELPPDWFKRQKADEKENQQVENGVKAIIKQVKENGDKALIKLTEKFDKAKIQPQKLKVTLEEIKEAYAKTSKEQIEAIKFIRERISKFEAVSASKEETQTINEGIKIISLLRPIESVGCYVPGGQAAYPSTLVMTATPAKVAGVPRIVVCSPPNAEGKVNPLVLVAADICGVDEIYKVGGAQAIAALAYGTETIKPVRKIVGPGNRYVTVAKILVSKDVAIDMPAGPSEVLVIADETADPKLIAFDMISQAEHGGDSVAGIITTSEKIALGVQENIAKFAASTDRSDKVLKSLEKNGFIITCKSIEEAVDLANAFAPEHLEIMTSNPNKIAEKVTAGLVLIGSYSPVALSDYAAGTNHVLPTGGFASGFSGLSALDFTRRVSIVESTKAGLEKAEEKIRVITEAENLPNHYKAIEARLKK